MESRRFLLAIVLMIASVVIINVIFPPPKPQPRGAGADSAQVTPSSSPGLRDQAPTPGQPALPAPGLSPAPATVAAAPLLAADTIIVESPLYRFGLSTRGAALVSAELLRYDSRTRKGAVQLAPESQRGLLSHRLRIDGQIIDLAAVNFHPGRRADMRLDSGSAPAALRFRGNAPNGLPVELTFSFRPLEYLIDVTARVGGGRAVQLLVDLGPTLAFNEDTPTDDERALAYVVNSRRDGIHSVPLRSIKRGTRIEEGPLDWIALKNKYFVFAAMPVADSGIASFGGLVAERASGGRFTANLTATLPVGEERTASYRVYAGPQEYERLAALDRQLEDVNPYGWRWVRPIIRPLGHAFSSILLSTHRATGWQYGYVLILFGVVIRLAMWPLNAKAMRSQMKGMELQPRIKDLQTRFKAQPELMQKEMLKLYREEKFNPMGGCLPMLLPMPVLITLFFVFQSTIEFRGVPFWWFPDLSRADPLYILPVLLAITMFIQQWLSIRSSPPNPQAKMLLWFMPGFMLFLFLNFASGLNLYYLAQNLTGFPQQLQLIRERQGKQGTSVTKLGVVR